MRASWHRRAFAVTSIFVASVLSATSAIALQPHGPHPRATCGNGGTCLSDTLSWTTNTQFQISIPNAQLAITFAIELRGADCAVDIVASRLQPKGCKSILAVRLKTPQIGMNGR